MRLRWRLLAMVCAAGILAPVVGFGQDGTLYSDGSEKPSAAAASAPEEGGPADQYQDPGQQGPYRGQYGGPMNQGPGRMDQGPERGPGNAVPGTVNYVEGAVFVGSRRVNTRAGRTVLQPSQMLATQQGRAEILLTPGVFLRLDSNTAVRMVSPELTYTEVELVRGHISLEVDELFAQNNLRISDAGVRTQILKPGYYEFNTANMGAPTSAPANAAMAGAVSAAVDVFVGEAAVDSGDGKYKHVKAHHEFVLPLRPNEKPAGFSPENVHSGLYNWSRLRSQYLAQANNRIAGQYYGAGYNPGWYWDPYAWEYTYLGLNSFWSPFGYGFYPFGWYGGWGWGGGYYGGGYRFF
jgi:hypothetical protein